MKHAPGWRCFHATGTLPERLQRNRNSNFAGADIAQAESTIERHRKVNREVGDFCDQGACRSLPVILSTVATAFPPRSSRMRCGCTFASRSACAWSRTCWPRGIIVTHQTIRTWAEKFGRHFADEIRRQSAGRLGDRWHLDELIVTIAGGKHWLWRAVDQDGFVLDVLVQSRRNAKAVCRASPAQGA
jgi:hypothetical protein